jgi:hypothetical protein
MALYPFTAIVGQTEMIRAMLIATLAHFASLAIQL